jgi:2-keto-4-pentenoate hydratase/2-oxohepta-3-ene-1,7-dioic acid hydratase in catechol pathway
MTQWVRFTPPGEATAFGTLQDGQVEAHEGDLFGEHRPTGRRHAVAAVRLEAPVVPSKVLALWNNFRALGEKLGKAPPVHPLFIIKPATSVTGPGTVIRRPARYAGKIVYEGELGIVIGRTCRNVRREEAGDYILGYTCVNDVTAAELLDADPNFAQWTRAKGSDGFCCLGPAVTTGFDWSAARVVTTLDGVERQNYPLSDMILPPHEIVSAVSSDLTLLPGDVIACGTSIGVGSMKPGAAVSVRIEGIGELPNRMGEG